MDREVYILAVDAGSNLSGQSAYTAMADALKPLGRVVRATLRPAATGDRARSNMIPSLTEALTALGQMGVKTLTVQPMMLLSGRFYGQLLETLGLYRHLFPALRVGLPLLHSPEDATTIAGAIRHGLDGKKHTEWLVLMAHGSSAGNGCYALLEKAMGEHCRVGVLSGEPSVFTLCRQLSEENVRRVCLVPCLLTPGKHGTEDLTRWGAYFLDHGFETEIIPLSLGLLPELGALLRSHAVTVKALPPEKGTTP